MIRTYRFVLTGAVALLCAACHDNPEKKTEDIVVAPKDSVAKPAADTAKGFKGETVPALCYHAIREIGPHDSSDQKAYSVTPANFALQMKTLADNGYKTVTPDEISDYYTNHAPLPEKPIMISFDDGRKDQVTLGASELEKYGFKGVFYVMTVSLGRNHYMTRDDVRALAAKGHTIGCHTWDHHKVTTYKDGDWEMQVSKPKKQLEELSGKPVTSFAYPYGVWNAAAADSLKAKGFTTAFIFYGKHDAERPLFTMERINGPNISNMEKFLKRITK